MIKPIFTDPNNHVPEVSPDDEWSDAETLHSSGFGPSTVLPPKKSRPETLSAAPDHSQGLRIEARPYAAPDVDLPRQLEVQEFEGSVLRLDPESPGAEKIPGRFTFLERPAEDPEKRLRRGEADDWGHARKYPLPWIIGSAAGVLAVVVGALMLLPMINLSNAARPPDTGLRIEKLGGDDSSNVLNDLLTRQPEAEQLFQTYASASTPDDVMPLVAGAGTLDPLIREKFIPNRIPNTWIPSENTTWQVFENAEKPYGVLHGKFPDFSSFRAYLEFSEGRLLIDWKATSAYCTATFAELWNGTGNAEEIRGWIIPDTYYSNTFPEAEYDSYQLFSPDEKEMVWCYVHHGQSTAAEISGIFSGGTIIAVADGPRKVTVRLKRGPEGALPNQWLVAGLLHMEWIEP